MEKIKSNIKYLILVLICIVVSLCCGVGGFFIANKLSSKTLNEENSTVILTSVKDTSNNGTVAEVANSALPSVVEITTEAVQNNIFLRQYVTEGAGSGVIISTDGYIVTNNHVIEDATKITVKTSLGEVYEAKLVGTDIENDIAVIKIDKEDLPVAVLGDSDKMVVGEEIVAIGNPLGSLGGTVTTGIVSALNREVDIDNTSMQLLQIDAAVNPGNSGGGLFDMSGLLVGVVNAKSSGSDIEGLGFAIPINSVKSIITDLIENGYVKGRVKLGVGLTEISDEYTAYKNRVDELGVYIVQVVEDSDAFKSGLAEGDYIKEVNGTRIFEISNLTDIMAEAKVGDELNIKIIRDGEEQTIKVTLTEYRETE